MITKFNNFSGVVSVKIDDNILYFHLKYDENIKPFKVELWLHDGKYDDLSINITDSKNLGHKEFYLNPFINLEIVETLKNEGFIEETGKESVAGDKKTKSYLLLI
ncbi:MAG: hypothetical protein HPY57_13580 [Ignavibacteria bacterium]|nr:hypothetical protein [Ignavibacteria bacterium]